MTSARFPFMVRSADVGSLAVNGALTFHMARFAGMGVLAIAWLAPQITVLSFLTARFGSMVLSALSARSPSMVL